MARTLSELFTFNKVRNNVINDIRLGNGCLKASTMDGSEGKLTIGSKGLVVATDLILNEILCPMSLLNEAKIVNPSTSVLGRNSKISRA